MHPKYSWRTAAYPLRFLPTKETTRILALFILLFWFITQQSAFAQKVVTESGEHKMRIEKSMSEMDAEKMCIEKARINAIENAFGVTV